MNLIYEESIRHSKPVPDFAQTDQYQVAMTLHGTVQDLDLIHREQKLTLPLKPRVAELLEQGVVERVARSKFVLSQKFYSFFGQKGVYTRKHGLDREWAARCRSLWKCSRPCRGDRSRPCCKN